jgi:prevent-host-death family protein
METFNIHEAKTHLSRLVEQVSAGETIILARAGRPVAKVSPVDAPAAPQRLGFLAGELRVPADFDRLGEKEIVALFGEPSRAARK